MAKDFYCLLKQLNDKIINSDYNNIKKNFALFQNFFNKITELGIEHKNDIINIKKRYEKSDIELKNLYEEEIKKIQLKFQYNLIEIKKQNDMDIQTLDDEYTQYKYKSKKEINNLINKYKNQIKFGETIYNAYNLNN